MKLKMIYGFILFLMSFSVFADTYNSVACYTVGYPASICYSTGDAACASLTAGAHMGSGGVTDYCYTSSGIYAGGSPPSLSYSCPGGGTVSGTYCIDAPPCPNSEVRNSDTGICGPPPCLPPQIYDSVTQSCHDRCDKSICTGSENPFSDDCVYSDQEGLKIDCTDGSTVNVPQTCPPNNWDLLFSPRQGENATCSDGSTIGYGANCLDRFVQRNILETKNPAVAAGAIFLGGVIGGGTRPVLTLVGTMMKMVFPIGVKTTGQELAVTSGRTVVEARTASQAIANYIKANPNGAYASQLKTAVDAAVPLDTLTIDPNTGELNSTCSIKPWSDLQVGNVAIAANGSAPLPLTEIEPFVNLETIPWIEPTLDAIEGDFRRVFVEPQSNPLNFPIVFSPLPSPTPVPVTIPWVPSPNFLIDVSPFSPTVFSRAPVPSPPPLTEPLPLPNPNPVPLPPINPADPIIMPIAPTLESDTYKFFDFLPTSNPFSFSPSLPSLPSSDCTYEIHQVVHVPFMGAHNFDIAPCVPLQPLRSVLAWFFAVLTIYTCINIIFRSSW